MLFNSFEFALFFPVVYLVYRLLKDHRLQNRFLLAASYFFYACWSVRFTGLLALSTATAWICALQIEKSTHAKRRKWLLFLSIAVDLGLLLAFKYFGFFAQNAQTLARAMGFELSVSTLNVVLPVGISFYTFQSIGYVVDVYRGKTSAVKHPLDFALFISFFPQLVAGPIERASKLVPQFLQPRAINAEKFVAGVQLLFVGLFKKVFVADNMATIVDPIFAQPAPYDGLTVMLGATAFSYQIYADFAGYSDMARGMAKMMGFELSINFNFPSIATSPSDFWKRWHITLSNWFRDYVFRSLRAVTGRGRLASSFNALVTMGLVGLWHGPAWTFVAWGLYYGVLLLAEQFLRALFPRATLPYVCKVILTFSMYTFGMLFFRASSMEQTQQMLHALVFNPTGGLHEMTMMFPRFAFFAIAYAIVEIGHYYSREPLFARRLPAWSRVPVYYGMFYGLMIWGVSDAKNFIYFQF